MANRWLKLSDGTTWPRPALESDEERGLAWVLTHGTPTREDLLAAASVIHAYGYLVLETTYVRRDQVFRDIRDQLRKEA